MFTADSEEARKMAINKWKSLPDSDKVVHKKAVEDNSVYINSLRYNLELDESKGKRFQEFSFWVLKLYAGIRPPSWYRNKTISERPKLPPREKFRLCGFQSNF